MTTSDIGSDTAVVAIDPLVFERRWKILAVLCTSLMVVIVGNTALNVALPTLARELRASTPAQQWMVDSYGLVFAGLLLTAGTIGDRYGRKGALQIGLLVFLAGSLSAAFMDSAGGVIAGRAVMGFGAAFVMPATLSILTNVFPPHERGKAIAIWAGISGGGAAIGPVASGFLLTHFSWGSVFLVNVPIIVVALVAGKVLLPTSRDPEPGALDPIGAVLSIAALGALVYAIIEAPHRGWASNTSLAWFAAAILLIAAFLMWELRNSAPMLDLRYFLDPRFGVAAGVITLVFFAMLGFFFLLTQYFQLVLGYGTLEAGVKQLPFAAVMMLLAPNSPRLAAKFGTNRVVAFGLVCVTQLDAWGWWGMCSGSRGSAALPGVRPCTIRPTLETAMSAFNAARGSTTSTGRSPSAPSAALTSAPRPCAISRRYWPARRAAATRSTTPTTPTRSTTTWRSTTKTRTKTRKKSKASSARTSKLGPETLLALRCSAVLRQHRHPD